MSLQKIDKIKRSKIFNLVQNSVTHGTAKSTERPRIYSKRYESFIVCTVASKRMVAKEIGSQIQTLASVWSREIKMSGILTYVKQILFEWPGRYSFILANLRKKGRIFHALTRWRLPDGLGCFPRRR